MRRRTYLSGVAGAGAVALAGCSLPGSEEQVPSLSSDWPRPRYDERSRGHREAYADIEDAAPSVRWTVEYDATGSRAPTPVVADGVVYVHTGTAVRALNAADGSERWRTTVVDRAVATDPDEPYVGPTPLAIADDRVFAGSPRGLTVLDPTGERHWSVDGDADVFGTQGAPVVVDGTVYFGLGDTGHAYGVDGTERWTASFESEVTSAPAVGREGGVHFGTETGVHRFTADGAHQWGGRVDASPWVSFAVEFDALFVPSPSDGARLVRLDTATGDVRDRLPLHHHDGPMVVPHAGDSAYVSVTNSLIRAGTDGPLSVQAGGTFPGSPNGPAASMAGTVLYVAHGERVGAYESLDGAPAWQVSIDGADLGSAPAVTDEAVFVADTDRIYAIA